jgi:hypothetical protein
VVAASNPASRFLLRHSVAYAYVRVAQKRAALTRADDFDTRRFRDELRHLDQERGQRHQRQLRRDPRAFRLR